MLVFQILPFNLVRERLLQFLSTDELFNIALLSRFGFDGRFEQFSVCFTEYTSRFLRDFPVVAILVSPLNVLASSLFEMLLQVCESMLCHVCYSQVRVLFDLACVRNSISGQKLDKGGFAGTVLAN